MAKNLKAMLAKKLAENNLRHRESPQETEFDEGRQHVRLDLDLIDPNPYQPRRSFPLQELNALASSIAETGLLQPVTVRKYEGRYQLIAGERRLRAHELLGKTSIEAIVVPSEDADLAVFALAENIDRQDLADYEIGLALRRIENLFPSKKKLAESLGLNREDMYRYFAFEALPQRLRAKLDLEPRLLSRSAASELKRLLEQTPASPELDVALDLAWSLLEQGSLEQGKMVGFINRQLQQQDVSRPLPSQRQAWKLARGGQQVGSMSRDDKHVMLKLKAGVLNDEEIVQLEQFVRQLLSHEV
ncbi:ParB/RepB/Spo0J family partition protein (plasmid) [Chromobacterium amazonense]|uniref:ParB/RepB/Spo0J family partition protein n=1 Tax=Chromobacterium amazonense TaxID=1382803 RepID=UPI00237EBED8|nr:ParB/RepB/Spo0J family partition protein [Chromobacterium amazonense]MDE1715275.1 ParB/RepB/Spo0J family partition protein [Chromobacterium amazonense]